MRLRAITASGVSRPPLRAAIRMPVTRLPNVAPRGPSSCTRKYPYHVTNPEITIRIWRNSCAPLGAAVGSRAVPSSRPPAIHISSRLNANSPPKMMITSSISAPAREPREAIVTGSASPSGVTITRLRLAVAAFIRPPRPRAAAGGRGRNRRARRPASHRRSGSAARCRQPAGAGRPRGSRRRSS